MNCVYLRDIRGILSHFSNLFTFKIPNENFIEVQKCKSKMLYPHQFFQYLKVVIYRLKFN